VPTSYDAAWKRYPVAPGEIWRVGPHVVLCGDHEAGAWEALRTRFPARPVMTYVDPPWTPALATGYRTKAGAPHRVDFPGLLRRIASVATWATGAIYVESGTQYEQAMVDAFLRAGPGLRHVLTWPITYYQTRPARLHLFSPPSYEIPERLPLFDGCDDEDTPSLAIQHASRAGDLVFDPCTGQGLTAETAAALDRRFIGIELHPGRMARALSRLATAQGCDPEPEGRL
jgi:hypothetical protein